MVALGLRNRPLAEIDSSGASRVDDAGLELFARLVEEGALAGVDLPWSVGHAEALRLHASTRSFYRLLPAEEGEPAAAVAVVYSPDDAEGVDRYRRSADWFAAAGVRVPRVFSVGVRALLVEDAGDRLLAEASLEPSAHRCFYDQAVDAVLAAQRHGERAPPPNSGWALDAERLRDELRFTEQHALEGWLGVSDGGTARERGFDRLVDVLVELPTAACHRDFHARNLLLKGRSLVVVDFQDVMVGPCLYDLASLVWDNYCDVPESIQGESLRRYWQEAGGSSESLEVAMVPPLPPGLPPGGRQAFCLVALQRHLKALGTFGYQVSVAGRPEYAEFAPRTWRHARAALEALGWDDLLAALCPLDRLLDV